MLASADLHDYHHAIAGNTLLSGIASWIAFITLTALRPPIVHSLPVGLNYSQLTSLCP